MWEIRGIIKSAIAGFFPHHCTILRAPETDTLTIVSTYLIQDLQIPEIAKTNLQLISGYYKDVKEVSKIFNTTPKKYH